LIPNVISDVVKPVVDTAGDVVDTVVDTAGDVVDTVVDTTGDAVGAAVDAGGNAVDNVGELTTKPLQKDSEKDDGNDDSSFIGDLLSWFGLGKSSEDENQNSEPEKKPEESTGGPCTATKDCTCKSFVPKNNTQYDWCKTCGHRDVEHKIE
jgi:hypothetical protein